LAGEELFCLFRQGDFSLLRSSNAGRIDTKGAFFLPNLLGFHIIHSVIGMATKNYLWTKSCSFNSRDISFSFFINKSFSTQFIPFTTSSNKFLTKSSEIMPGDLFISCI